MSPPLHGVMEQGKSNISLEKSSVPVDIGFQTKSELKERNYMGLSVCPSEDKYVVSNLSDEKKSNLNLKETELRLGLPGPQSPESDPELNEKQFFSLLPSKDGHISSIQKPVLLGNKRGFSDAMSGISTRPSTNLGVKSHLVDENTRPELEKQKQILPREGLKDGIQAATGNSKMGSSTGTSNRPAAKKQVVGWPPIKSSNNNITSSASKTQLVGWPPIKSSNNTCNTPSLKAKSVVWPPVDSSRNTSNPPASEAQVVGWPPVRSFRRNTLASTSKNNDEVDGNPGPGPLYVKVSMDGAPYLRKVDLRNYSTYQELSSALSKMFRCFSIGQCGSDGAPGSEMMSESKLQDLLHGSEDVLTYEDKDGDWMLVGDVPWEMFTDSCKRLRIMKSTDAIGLAPRAVEKCKSRN